MAAAPLRQLRAILYDEHDEVGDGCKRLNLLTVDTTRHTFTNRTIIQVTTKTYPIEHEPKRKRINFIL